MASDIDKWLNQIHPGDCLEFMRLLPDKCVDLILTDPPYGIGEAAGKNRSRSKAFGSKSSGLKNPRNRIIPSRDYGNLTWDDNPPSPIVFQEMLRVSKNQIIFGGNYFVENLRNSSCWIFWDKDNSGDFADGELAWTSFNTAVRRFKWRWNGMLQQDMKNKEERIHPTQKPIKLGIWLLSQYSKPGEIVLDCFAGSGSFLIAASQLGRQWIGFEINPEYVNMARERIARETAQLNMFVGVK